MARKSISQSGLLYYQGQNLLGSGCQWEVQIPEPQSIVLMNINCQLRDLKITSRLPLKSILRNGIPCIALLVLEAPLEIVLTWVSVSRPREIITQTSMLIKTLWGSLKTKQIPGLPAPVDSDSVNLGVAQESLLFLTSPN